VYIPVCSVCYFAVSSCWATVCTMVRPMLSDRCPVCLSVCLSVLSVTLVYCCQTVGWIKMKFGLQVGLGPGHIVLDGDPASPPLKGGRAPPIFDPYLLWPNGWMDEDATWYGGRPQPRPHCVRRGSGCSPATGAQQLPPLFGPCLLWLGSPIPATAELLFSQF